MGLAAALRRYAEELLDAAGADVRVGIDGPRSKVPEHVELALYRIGQEALNNVARHAGAQNVWIDIAYSDSSVSLTVRDDGAGFDPAEAARSGSAQGGLGLAGMQERVALVDGSVTIDSAPGRGTTVRAEVPVDADV
jgi:signal transduction histidine kinase